MKTALICVDVQNDFLPGGALGVEDGHQITPVLEELAESVDLVVFTRDLHPANHISFAERPRYEDGSWPPHCVYGTDGARIDEMLWQRVHALGKRLFVVDKGEDPSKEAYSGFQGHVNHFDDDRSLTQLLDDEECNSVLIGGLALDYCVLATAIDAYNEGYRATVILEATRPVSYLTGARAVRDLVQKGVRVE